MNDMTTHQSHNNPECNPENITFVEDTNEAKTSWDGKVERKSYYDYAFAKTCFARKKQELQEKLERERIEQVEEVAKMRDQMEILFEEKSDGENFTYDSNDDKEEDEFGNYLDGLDNEYAVWQEEQNIDDYKKHYESYFENNPKEEDEMKEFWSQFKQKDDALVTFKKKVKAKFAHRRTKKEKEEEKEKLDDALTRCAANTINYYRTPWLKFRGDFMEEYTNGGRAKAAIDFCTSWAVRHMYEKGLFSLLYMYCWLSCGWMGAILWLPPLCLFDLIRFLIFDDIKGMDLWSVQFALQHYIFCKQFYHYIKFLMFGIFRLSVSKLGMASYYAALVQLLVYGTLFIILVTSKNFLWAFCRMYVALMHLLIAIMYCSLINYLQLPYSSVLMLVPVSIWMYFKLAVPFLQPGSKGEKQRKIKEVTTKTLNDKVTQQSQMLAGLNKQLEDKRIEVDEGLKILEEKKVDIDAVLDYLEHKQEMDPFHEMIENLPEGLRVVINPVMLKSMNNSKKYEYWAKDAKNLYIQGMVEFPAFKFEQFVALHAPMASIDQDLLFPSKDGVLGFQYPCDTLPITLYMDERLCDNVMSRITRISKGLIPLYFMSNTCDKNVVKKSIRQNYLAKHPPYDDLNVDIRNYFELGFFGLQCDEYLATNSQNFSDEDYRYLLYVMLRRGKTEIDLENLVVEQQNINVEHITKTVKFLNRVSEITLFKTLEWIGENLKLGTVQLILSTYGHMMPKTTKLKVEIMPTINSLYTKFLDKSHKKEFFEPINCYTRNEAIDKLMKINGTHMNIPFLKLASKPMVMSSKYNMAIRQAHGLLPELEPTFHVTFEPDESKINKPKIVQMYGTTLQQGLMVLPDTNDPETLVGGLMERIGKAREIDEKEALSFVEHSKQLLKDLPIFEIPEPTEEQVRVHLCSQYGVVRGMIYYNMIGDQLIDSDVVSKLFPKVEFYVNKSSNKFKERQISARSFKIIAKFSWHFHQLGKMLKEVFGLFTNILISSGLTPAQVGEWNWDKFLKFGKRGEGDATSWDGAMNKHFLDVEKWFLKERVTGMPEEIDFLLENWHVYKGIGFDGQVRLSCDYGRRSGDLWTTDFNSLLNILSFMYVHQKHWTDDFALVVLGDDSVFYMNEIDEEETVKIYSQLGIEMKLIFRENFEDITFCSGYFVPNENGWVWQNDFFRVLMKLGFNYNNHPEKVHMSLLHGIAKSLFCTAGMWPIIWVLLDRIVETAEENGIAIKRDFSYENPYRFQGGNVSRPDHITYVYFCEKYDIPMYYVFELEDWIRKNVTILDFPYMISDVTLNETYREVAGLENTDETTKFVGMENKNHYECVVVPEREEAEKLMGATNCFEAMQNAYLFGLEENELIESVGHEFLHMIFTFLSWMNFYWGVTAHGIWNWSILEIREHCLKLGLKLCKKPTKNKGKTKKKVSKKVLEKAMKGRKIIGSVGPKNKSLIKQALEFAGGYAGGFFGPVGRNIGMKAGAGISRIIGSGSYNVMDNSSNLSKNSVLSPQAPKFLSSENGITIAHSEFIMDVYGSTTFTISKFAMQPGDAKTFQLLKEFSNMFTEWEPLGMVGTFKSMCGTSVASTTTTLGTVILAHQPNVLRPDFVNKAEMEQYEFSMSGRPDQTIVCGVECAKKDMVLKKLFVRSSSTSGVEDDLRFSDHGNFYLATVGMQAVCNIGEFWFSYHVRFFNIRVPQTIGSGDYLYYHATSYTNASPFGGTIVDNRSTLGVNIYTEHIEFLDQGTYLVYIQWAGSAVSIVNSTITRVGCSRDTKYNVGDATGSQASPQDGVSSIKLHYVEYVTVTSLAPTATMSFSGGTLPSSGTDVTLEIFPIATVPSAIY